MATNPASFPSRGDEPLTPRYTGTYQAAAPHQGVGMVGVYDKAGLMSRLDIDFTYAYHMGLAPNINLALGVAAGFSSINLDYNKITTEIKDDPAITSQLSSKIKPDLGTGIYLYGTTYFLGLSAQQLIGQRLSFTADNKYLLGKEVIHYFASGGYKFYLNDDIAILPSVMVKYIKPLPTTMDFNMKAAFRGKFWVGGSYRRNDSFGALFGMNINNTLSLSYSYDINTSALKTVSNCTHEIVLGFMFNKNSNPF